ncbi:MAG: C39 family peptidase [Hyalangium sp.]|uniref:C39 family peptidase n=1 Tax=Hyalangium sp. TaxID=2028555 RepID=UPI00389A5A68
MTRINSPLAPPRPHTVEGPSPAQATKAPASTPTAQPAGFSGDSAFQKGVASSSAPAALSAFAPSGAEKLSPNDLGVLAQDQGNTNACGTTSLANVLTYWGKPTTHEQVDSSIRHFDLFTAPDKIVSYARDHGMRAEMKTDASVEDLAHMVDQGVPPIILMDPDSNKNANMHYMTVSGYDRDDSGKITDVVVADSAGGYRYKMSAEDFQQKWNNLKMGGISTGLSNVMISVVPNDGRKVVGGDGATRNAADIHLPKSSLGSAIKTAPARAVTDVITDVTTAADKVEHAAKDAGKAIGDGAKKAWHSIFG